MKIKGGEAGKASVVVSPAGASTPVIVPFNVARTENARNYAGGMTPEELKEIHHALSTDAKQVSLPCCRWKWS